MNRPTDLTVVVVSYETRELTLDCLAALRGQRGEFSVRVIVVDNASSDGSAAAIAEAYPDYELMALEENVGFARANNLAAARADGRYLLLLNPDTVASPGTLGALVRYADAHPEVGIVGGRTTFADGSLNPSSCWGRPTLWSALCLGLGLTALLRQSPLFDPESLGRWARDTERRVDIVSGCLLLVRRELWGELGGFDEDFFMYGEDADLCLRAGAAGWTCAITPEAEIVHLGGASERIRADKMVRLFQARARLYRKHWSRLAAPLGVRSQDLWALTRMCALGALWLIQPRRRDSFSAWREIWRRRREWRLGARRAPSAWRRTGSGRGFGPIVQPTSERRRRVLAVSSGGGHWVQMKRLLPALEGTHLTIATVDDGARGEVECDRFLLVGDASTWNKVALARSALRVLWILVRYRPQVVLSTGAAPGFFAVCFGRLLGARTIWVDSMANAEELSLSGRKAGRYASLWLTQWPHLARPGGPEHRGSVL